MTELAVDDMRAEFGDAVAIARAIAAGDFDTACALYETLDPDSEEPFRVSIALATLLAELAERIGAGDAGLVLNDLADEITATRSR